MKFIQQEDRVLQPDTVMPPEARLIREFREVDSQCLSEQDRYFSHYDLNMTHFLCHVFIYDRYPSRAQKTVKEFHLSKLNFSQGMTFEIF